MPELEQEVPTSTGPISDSKAMMPLTTAEAATDSDLKMLKVVLGDIEKAESYISQKRLPQIWNDFDDLYRAYVVSRTWPGSDVARSNIGMPIILEAIEEVLPQIFMAFFSEKQPFTLDPIGTTPKLAADAAAKLVKWGIKVSGFKEEIRLALKSSLLYGFQVSKYGWKKAKHKTFVYKRKAQPPSVPGALGTASVDTTDSNVIIREPIEIEITEPTFENFHLRNVLFDPTLARQDVRKGKWLCFQFFYDLDGLDELRDNPAYKNIPSNDVIRAFFVQDKAAAPDELSGSKYVSYRENQAEKKEDGQTQTDPDKEPIQVLEYWDSERVFTVLRLATGQSYCIRNEAHEFGSVPGLSNAFIDVLGSAYGFGVSHLLRGEQRFQQGVLNSWVDQLALVLRPMFQRIGAPNGGQQNIAWSPGQVRNEQAELKQLTAPDVSNTAETALQSSDARASKRIGLNATDIPTQALRTGTGVQSFQAAIAGKLQYFIEIFTELVYIPALEAFLQMIKDRLNPQQIQYILTTEEGKAFDGEVMDIYQGKYKFDVLASTKLAARKAAAQLVPTLVQLFSAAPVQEALTAQGMKADFAALIELFSDLSALPTEEIIVPMSDEDKKKAEANSPAAIAQAEAQNKAQLQQQEQQNKLQQIDEKGQAQAGNTIVRSLLKNAENQSALEGKVGELMGGQ